MADPFSIIAVTQTGLSVAQALTKLIQALRSAPDELLALSNEVWNLKLVLDDLQELESSHNAPSAHKLDVVHALVYQIRIKLDTLSSLTVQWGRLSQWGDSFSIRRRDRFSWLKEKARFMKLQSELRELRSNLSTAVGTKTCTAVSRLEVNMQSMLSQVHGMSAETRGLAAPTACDPDPASIISEVHRNQHEILKVLQDMVQSIPNLSVSDTVDPRPKQRTQSESSVYDAATSAKLQNASIDQSAGFEKLDSLSMAVTRPGKTMREITGYLLLGYSGRHILQQQCVPSCFRRTLKSMQMTYFFPRWFVGRAISISMSNTISPTLSIKSRRVVPEVNQLFSLSKFGDVEGIRFLFNNRLASPDDVHIRWGKTALHFAVDHSHIDLCQLLINCGADPEWVDGTGTTPAERAWRNILSLRAPLSMFEAFSLLFSGTKFIQERRFTRLHRLVIGLETSFLEQELIESPQSVHALDLDGWTPLHWASRCGNYRAMCLLLEHGADPHQGTINDKRNALHLAAQSNSAPCVQRILQYRRGNLLLDIDGPDNYGSTPLRLSACHNSAATTAILIQHGANLNIGERFGETPLQGAVFENAHETITHLLTAGADYTLKTIFGNTIMHWAANEADQQTLRILSEAQMRGVDVDAKNADGITATELAAIRCEHDEALRSSFERLVNSLSDEQDEDGELSSCVSGTSSEESWKSVEDVVWHEADWAAEADVVECLDLSVC
ncbi:hypothetical protein JMJ35_004779 [Cladonia borealis]|uniref:Ankyrin n=1 Tax=Cladonia borealis TaxID=184061 RepID=A0AA39R0P3_9LECA|nr:hypothetical protein JMJ35_004779 [Cladonia borealis]